MTYLIARRVGRPPQVLYMSGCASSVKAQVTLLMMSPGVHSVSELTEMKRHGTARAGSLANRTTELYDPENCNTKDG